MMSDTTWDDADRLRRRQAKLDDDQVLDKGLDSLPSCVVGKLASGTGAVNTFATFEIQTVLGTETDGSTGTLSGTGVMIKAMNLGGTTPAAGAAVICHRTNYRWAFRYG
jgi:hypothetical protein